MGYFHEQPGPEQTTNKAFGFKDWIPRPHSTYSYFRKQIAAMVVFHNESKTCKSFVPPVYSKQTVVPSFILCFFEWSFPRISYTAAISASARVQHWKLALQFFQATWKATIDLVKLALDVTRPGPPKGSFLKGKWDNLISGKSRLVKYYLGASFKYLLFSALLGEDSNFDSYFSNGLKPPTSYNLAW